MMAESGTGLYVPSEEDIEEWRQDVRKAFPDLKTETYSIPPLFSRRVPHSIREVPQTGQNVKELKEPVPKGKPKYGAGRPAAPSEDGLLWRDPQVSPGKGQLILPENAARGESAEEHMFQCLETLTERLREPMVILSNLSFGRHPSKDTYDPTAVEFRMREDLFGEGDQGECDILIISQIYGIIICEVKAVGSRREEPFDINKALKKVMDPPPQNEDATDQLRDDSDPSQDKHGAIHQLNKARRMIAGLLDRIGLHPNISVTLALPYVTPDELEQAAAADSHFQDSLIECFGVTHLQSAVSQCLCTYQSSSIDKPGTVSGRLITELEAWWKVVGKADKITYEIYETLVAIFCGPAVTVHLATLPSAGIRTLAEGVAEYGWVISQLTLYREQINLVNKAVAAGSYQRVFLYGPPGTGKTVVLALAGLRWMAQGHDVYVLSTNKGSLAVSMLLQAQIQMSFLHRQKIMKLDTSNGPEVHRLEFRFDTASKEMARREINRAVCILTQGARTAEKTLHVLVDEAGPPMKLNAYVENFNSFCEQLKRIVPNVCIWAASMCDEIEGSRPHFRVEKMTRLLRNPERVAWEVIKSKHYKKVIPPYESSNMLYPGNGPKLINLRHRGQRDHHGTHPKDCRLCGQNIAAVLKRLNVGRGGPRDLKYRDALILCYFPNKNLEMVRGLQANVPVLVVESKGDRAAIKEMALMETDKVTVAPWDVTLGLERDVVIGIYIVRESSYCRAYGMSRCRSQLFWIDAPVTSFGSPPQEQETDPVSEFGSECSPP